MVDVTGILEVKAETAHYEMVGTGLTGHAELIQVRQPPRRNQLLGLSQGLLHDPYHPTELNFQGPDYGTQYRSVIFCANDGQKKVAEGYIRALNDAKVFSKPIVTQVVPLKAFYARRTITRSSSTTTLTTRTSCSPTICPRSRT